MPRKSGLRSRAKVASSKNNSTKRNSKNVNNYTHYDASRISIPTEQLESGVKKDLKYKPDLTSSDEPTLCWKRNYSADEISPPLLHIREKISPQHMIDGLRMSRSQTHIFDHFNGFTPGTKYMYYDHSAKGNWQNRIIRGDSARVMAALASEDIEDEVQTIFFDPPYGIKFNANFTPSMERPKDSLDASLKPKSEFPKDPVSVQAFCDMWADGLDSYFDAMYRRLILMRSLLKNTGSIFVQIGSFNVHRMALLLDEVFGSSNRISTISVPKSSGTTSSFIPEGTDFILWYAKNKPEAKHEYTQIYESDPDEKIDTTLSHVMIEEGNTSRLISAKERSQLPRSSIKKLFRGLPLDSQGHSTTGRSNDYVWNGKVYSCPQGRHWSIDSAGLDRLDALNRLAYHGNTLVWKRYERETPGKKINNRWFEQHQNQKKRYSVQTPEAIIERCILMSSKPGDLVLDPTGGSGSTASVAEKHGRRWIVIDTSHVSIATMRHYMSTKIFEWYLLQDSKDGAEKEKELGGTPKSPPYNNDPSMGFVYERVPNVSPKILGYDEPVSHTLLVDHPIASKGTMRVSGPFTVESESSYYVISSLSDHPGGLNLDFTTRVLDRISTIIIESLDSSQKITINDLTLLPKFDGLTHIGINNNTKEKIALLVTPNIVPADNRLIHEAALSAKKRSITSLVVAAFEFQPLSIPEFVEGVQVIKVSINTALQQSELDPSKIERAFVMVGDPRLLVTKNKGKWTVEISGFDMYNPISGNITNGDKTDVDCWMIDTQYDGKSFYARELHFPNGKSLWAERQMQNIKTMLGKDIDKNRWQIFESLKSAPFVSESGKIAVKIITVAGDEMMIQGSLDSLMKHSQSK